MEVGTGRVDDVVFWGGLDNLIQEKSEEGYVMIEVRPGGYIDGPSSGINTE